jgi:hypothetical protein
MIDIIYRFVPGLHREQPAPGQAPFALVLGCSDAAYRQS